MAPYQPRPPHMPHSLQCVRGGEGGKGLYLVRRQGPLSREAARASISWASPQGRERPSGSLLRRGGDGRRSRCEQGPEEGGPSVEEALVIAAPSRRNRGGQ